MKRTIVSLLLAGGLMSVGLPASAQSYHLSGFGAKVGYSNPENLDGTPMLGAHLEFERGGSQLHFMPSVMYWKTNDVSNWNPNIDAYYHFQPAGTVSPYLGAGLGLNMEHNANTDHSSSNLGANLFGGLSFPAAGAHAFVEGRVDASKRDNFALLGGMTFLRR